MACRNPQLPLRVVIQALETIDLEILVLLFQTYIEVVHVRPADEQMPAHR